jgi:hypothetical protein
MGEVIKWWLAQPYIPTDSEPHTIPMDETEQYRRARQAELNSAAVSASRDEERARLETEYGKGNVWTSEELRASQYEVIGFMAPFVVVRDRTTGKKGSMEFQHSPRFYFNFQAD